ncbi:hypothetical protein BDY19DRAFT_996422 [Irpex rosettiformis]|uniref:Uncharacterized protein n=1 Tax=Irpex rosettiformis TaxID=378272 RepID=A0ACB8TUX2_9APHY|nr:hypothetical protein BDY19DRAFT_996422 [Irpex rosettiformis]
MSQMHSHGPGQPMHSHGPAPAPNVQQQQQQRPVVPQPDPVVQAVIEASFQPVDIRLGPPDNVVAQCGEHGLEKCADCDVNYVSLNQISRLMHMNPNLRCPPPPQMTTVKLTQAVTTTKDDGNACFKAGQHMLAIQKYTMAANLAIQRPPWEVHNTMREELSTNLSNRSAAYFEAGDYMSALVDAELVIQLRKQWSKGYFRKAKALVKLDQLHDAKETVQAGLVHEPENIEMLVLLASIEANIQERVQAKVGSEKSEKTNGVENTAPTA